MSTNYLWASDPVTLPTGERVRLDQEDPRVHIGKRGGGGFTWAQPRAVVGAACRARPGERLIETEPLDHLTHQPATAG